MTIGGGFDAIIHDVALAATRLGVDQRDEFHRIVLDALFTGTDLGAASIWRLDGDVYVREAGRGVSVPDLPEGLRVPIDRDRRTALEAAGHAFIDTRLIDVGASTVDMPDRRALMVPFGGGTAMTGMLVLIDRARRTWSAEELAGVKSLALLVAQTLGRFRAEELVQDQVRRESLLARVGAIALAITPDTAGARLDDLLGDVLDHLGAVEAAIWRNEDGILRRRWVVRRDRGPWFAGPTIDATAIGGLSARGWAATDAAAIAGPTGAGGAPPVGSTIVAVAHDGAGELLGALSLTDPDPDRRWVDADAALVRAIADVLGLLRTRLDVTGSLERQQELHAVLGEATGRFIDATAAEAPAVIDRALERMRDHLGLSSVALLELDLPTLRVTCTAEAAAADADPVIAPHLPLPRDHPTIARVLDPGTSPRWSLTALFPGVPAGATAVVVPEVRGRDVMIVVGTDLTGAVVPIGDPGDDGEAVRGIRALAGVIALLRRRLELEAGEQRWWVANDVLARIAASFVDQPAHDHDRAVVGAFREVGELFGYRTVGRWDLEPDGSVRHVCGWLNPDADLPESDLALTTLGRDDRLLAQVRAGAALPLEPGALAPTPAIASDSLLVLPIRRHGRVVAGIAAVHPDPPHVQVDLDVQREVLRRLAELVEQLDRRAEVDRVVARQLDAEDRLRRFASRLVELDAQAHREVEVALGDLVAGVGVDRAVVWRTRDGAGATVVTSVFEAGSDADTTRDRGLGEVRLPGGAGEHELTTAIRSALGPDPDGTRVVEVLAADRDDEPTLLSLGRPGPVPFTDHELEFFRSALSILVQHEARVAAERWFRAAFRSAPIGIVLREADGRLIHCNDAYCRLLGREVAELVGTVPADVVVDTAGGPHGDRGATEQEVAYGRPDGTVRWVTDHTVPVAVPGRRSPLLLSYATDVTEQRHAARQLEYQATHDELTGLPNRRAFMLEASQALRGAGAMAVLVIDLDRFKVVNDSLGHTVGDALLVSCADRIRLSLRPGDTVCRLGGDEFAVLIRSDADGADLAALADRLLGLLRHPVVVGEHEIYPSGSIGIARAQSGDRVEDLLRRADIAMYAAKSQGRDRWSEFDVALQRRVDDRLRVEAELRRAIDGSELEVHYQPEVMLGSGALVGCEALVRWRHPEQGLLPASTFIAIAEETGLVVGLGRRVLEAATRQAAAWEAMGHDLLVRVNLSTRQLRRAVVAEVEAALGDTGLAPERLCLELTETALMEDVAESARILGEFRALGVRVAIDDFGTGFSSLAYLKRLPVDILKIDRTFVAGVGDDPDDTAIVESVIGLAHTLGLDVVAEGIETRTQRDELVRLGCARGQGYHFGRPVAAATITRRLRTGRVIAG